MFYLSESEARKDTQFVIDAYSHLVECGEELSGVDFAERIRSTYDQTDRRTRYLAHVAEIRVYSVKRSAGSHFSALVYTNTPVLFNEQQP